MDSVFDRAHELRQALADFVLEAEGELAVSLESYSAAQLSRTPQDMQRRSLVVDRFIAEGIVGDKTPIALFLEEHPALSESDRQLVLGWHRSFIGLFAVQQVSEDKYELMNWTTAKLYSVRQADLTQQEKMSRLGSGDIILVQIAPVTATEWMFTSPCTILGKLGKPKLAVAIGNFKDNYKSHLYSDAPELLAEAWTSVEQHHQNFVEFFGDEEVTLSGYQLGKKLTEFQGVIAQKSLKAAGIDPSKSLEDLVTEAGVSSEDIAGAAQSMGADAKAVTDLLANRTKMVAPQVELPPHLKKAERITVLTHPRWGQMFLPNYASLKALLETGWQDLPSIKESGKEMVQRHLKDPEMNSFVWHRLAGLYPDPLEALLQFALERPAFSLKADLDPLLQEFGKATQPELPEIASVPLHLHNLFQEALLEVNKDKSKAKGKKKPAAGFQSKTV